MNNPIWNAIKKIKGEKDSASLLFCYQDPLEQISTVQRATEILMDIPPGRNYKTNPDVFGIWPENIDGKTIKIEQIHEFIRKIQLRPFNSTCKVGIVLCAEKMTEEAQNALLKTLEEPPAQTFILLGASSPHALIETILSRCQVFDFSQDLRNTTSTISVEDVLKQTIIKRFALVEKLITQKSPDKNESITTLINLLIEHFRSELLTHPQKQEENLATIKMLERTTYAYERNVNTRLLLENMMLQLP